MKSVRAITILAVLAASSVAQDDPVALVRGYNAAGFRLFRESWPADDNVVFSPYSIGAAMTMTLAGARGETAAEMAHALGVTQLAERLDAAQREARAALLRSAERPGIQLRIANGLALAQHGDLILPTFRHRVRDAYAAEIFAAPSPAEANAWVERETRGRIQNLIPQYPPNCVAVLLNAIWFKGLWQRPFDPTATGPGRFTRSDGGTIEAPTMRQTGKFAVARNETMEAIALPYEGGDLEMIFLLPPRGQPLSKLEAKLDVAFFEKCLSSLREAAPGRVRLSVPRFRMTARAGLVPGFKALGVVQAFSDSQADFGGMTGAAPGLIWIADIVHQAFIEVNEEGSEAAAATGVIMVTRAALPREDVFAVDRPALYFIVHRPTGAALFVGRLADPR